MKLDLFKFVVVFFLLPVFPVTLPGALLAPVFSTSAPHRSSFTSSSSSSSMQTSYRLPNPLPPLPVRKGVRGRRPKSQTLALLKAAAEAAVNGASQSLTPDPQLTPKPHKKRGPKPKGKVRRPRRSVCLQFSGFNELPEISRETVCLCFCSAPGRAVFGGVTGPSCPSREQTERRPRLDGHQPQQQLTCHLHR